MLSGISLPHILLLLVIVVLVFGTSKLKNLGKDLGSAIKGFKESVKSEDDVAAPTPPAAQIKQTQTPPAQPTAAQQPTDQKSGQ